MQQATLAEVLTRRVMPNFTYSDNIPAASHNPSADQPLMQINTNSIDGIIAVDHFSFNDNDGGYHKKSTYISNNYTLAAPPTTIAGQVALYAFNTGVGGNALAFVRDGLTTGVQLTDTQAPISTANGSTFLPGGILIQWGSGITVAGFLTQSYTPAFSTIFSETATAISLGSTTALISVAGLSNSDITIYSNNSAGQPVSTGVFWMAIGLA